MVLNEALRERHMGYLQGLTWHDAVQGGGESMNQLNERCVSYLNKIAQQHIGNQQMSSSPRLASNRLNNHKNLCYISLPWPSEYLLTKLKLQIGLPTEYMLTHYKF